MTMLVNDVLFARSEAAAAEDLYRQGRTDGLPIVVPTRERVEAMLLYSGGLDRDLVLGDIGPSAGRLTVEKAAINAVMAGCPNEIFPLVIAAGSAIADPLFDAGPMQVTTHCITPFVIVNGPARAMYEVNSGCGALGPGFRTNATLGRAVRFMLINVGGGVPGVGDMATLGTPAKFTCCMGEDEEESPWEPLHVSRGFAAEDSTVTVLGVEGPHSFIFDFDEVLDGPDLMLRHLGAAMANPGSNNIFFSKGMMAVVLQPLHFRMLGEAGMSRRDAQQKLWEYASNTREALRKVAGVRVNMAPHDGDILYAVPSPDDLLIMAGGSEGGAYSMFMPSWCGGTNGQVAVTKKVRFDDYCETPDSIR